MNQKEYELIAEVIRGRKINATQSAHFGYSQKEIEDWLAVLTDLQDFMAYELARNYPKTFDHDKFIKACGL